jgi:hypothetical protein
MNTVLRRLRSKLSPRGALYSTVNLANLILEDVYSPPAMLRGPARSASRTAGDLCSLLLFVRTGAKPTRLADDELTVIFVGPDHGKAQLTRLLFEHAPHEEALPSIPARRLQHQAEAWLAGDEADLVVCELPRSLPPRPGSPLTLTVPTWIDHRIALPRAPEELLAGKRSERRRAQIRKCLERGYTSRFSDSLEDFDYFYHTLYVPYAQHRHGSRFLVTPYETAKKWFLKGGLLLVVADGKTIAGNICYMQDDVFHARDRGMLSETEKYWREGGSSIVDWFCIPRAYEQGAKVYHQGGTRGWHSDGVFWYKALWGARPYRRSAIYPVWRFFGENLTSVTADRFNRAGFLTECNGGLYWIYLTRSSRSGLEQDLGELTTLVRKRRLDGVVIRAVDGERIFSANELERLTAD